LLGVVVFVVKVEYGNAVLVPKIERAITKHGEINSQITHGKKAVYNREKTLRFK
jgi:hypothetical protein